MTRLRSCPLRRCGVFAASGNVLWFAGGLVIVYAGLAATGVFVEVQLHGAIAVRQRATMLSVQSLVLQISGAVSGLFITRVAVMWSIPAALLLAGGVALLGVQVLLAIRDDTEDDESSVGGIVVADCPS